MGALKKTIEKANKITSLENSIRKNKEDIESAYNEIEKLNSKIQRYKTLNTSLKNRLENT